MGRSQLPLPIVLVTLTFLTVTQGQYYDVFQGIQQLFQPYPGPNYFPQYEVPRQTNTQRLPQESKKKIDDRPKTPVNQYDYVFSTTPKPSKTRPSSHKQVNSYTFSNIFTPEVTTKRNRVTTNRVKTTTGKPKTTPPFNRDAIIFNDSKATHENLGFRPETKRVTNSRNPNVQHIDINPDFVKPANSRNPDVQATSTPKKTAIGSAITGIRRVTNAYNINRGNLNTDFDGTPMINSPGVRPAPVDVNQPPITNRPVEKNNFVPYDRPDDVYGSEKTSDTPEILIGPDEDDMTERQKRRYIDMAEKMCDRYKSLSVKEVVALPLLPSPDPAEAVELNVSSCTPITVPLVIGGRIASINEFPHMALVGWRKVRSTGYSWKCGGSLISERYVLTAGHCTYQDKDYDVESGPPQAVQLGSSILDDPNALVVKISAVIRHPKYKQRRSYYDLALIKLLHTVKFTDVIRPACLGVPPSVGKSIIATGWGRTEFGGDHSRELRSVSLPVWDMTECREVWGTSLKLPNGPLPDSHVCAAEKKGGKDTCQGDSGGPAQIQDGCVWRVVAVTSYGRSCGAPNTPALYAVTKQAFIAAQVFGDSDDRQDRDMDRKPSYSTRPSVSDRNPDHSDKNPTYSDRNPSYSDRNPSYSDRNPSYTDRNPSYSDRNPSYSSRPSSAEKQPIYSNTKPSYSDRNPSYSDINPSYSDRNPSYADRNPSYSNTKPSYSDRNPSYSDRSPSYFDRNPSFSQRQPSYSSIPSYSEREPPYFERQPSFSPSYSDIQPGYFERPAFFDSPQGFVNTKPYYVNNFRRQ